MRSFVETNNERIMNLFKNQKSFNELLPDFLSDRRVALSKITYNNYVSKFNIISTWLRQNNFADAPLRKIDNETIAKFFNYLAVERNLDKPTCEKYMIVLRMFFNYALKRGYVDYLPFDLIVYPNKKQDMGAKVIQRDELNKLLNPIKQSNKQLHLALMFEFYCALRPGNEIRLMKVEEIDLDAGVIRIPPERAKSRRKEVVTMPNQLINLCRDYGINGVGKNLYVFGKGGGMSDRPWSVNMLRRQFNDYRDSMGLSKDIKLYSAKHTGITRLAESGVPIRSIMDHARHTNLSATQKYIQRHVGIIDERIKCNFPNPI